MTLKNIRPLIVLLCLMLMANIAVAQKDDQHNAVVLRVYYSDLYLALSRYELDDIPFKTKQAKVQRNDSLLTIAHRYPMAKLDSFHLAAALYEANLRMFSQSDSAQFRVGASIKMPSVGDIFYAESRYEKLKVVGGNLDFTNEKNQMRNGFRPPFSKSKSLIGPFAVEADTLLLADATVKPVKADVPDVVVKAQDEPEIAALLDPAHTKQISAPVGETALVAEPNPRQESIGIGEESAAGAVAAVVEPAIAIDASSGPPTNTGVVSVNGVSSDPLSSIVEWNYDADASLGVVFNELAVYVGYELITTDEVVLDTYVRQLPELQRSVSGVTAEEGFLMLAGRGLDTVFNHVTRSVEHTPRKESAPMKITDSVETSATIEDFVQASGVASMLQQFPAEIVSAAERHASRCDSSVGIQSVDAERIHKLTISGLRKKVQAPAARELVDWYQSPTGREVLRLEQQPIDDAGFERFSMDDSRTGRIIKIYNNTVTGRGIASVAVEMDYAGWSLSGCKQQAENAGDTAKLTQEIDRGKGIKKKLTKLEAVLRADMLSSLAYQFSSLNDRELTEYADVVTRHASLYEQLQQSIFDAIELETEVSRLSSLD